MLPAPYGYTLGKDNYNVIVNNGKDSGQEIPHVHFHIIPKHADGSGLGIVWPAGELVQGETLAAALAEAI